MSKEYLRGECEKVSKELKRLLVDEKGWELKKDSKVCKVFSIPATHTPGTNIWKGEAHLTLKPEQIIDMVHPTEKYRTMWDPNIASCRLIQELANDELLCHSIMKPQLLGLLSARDSIDVFKLEETAEYYSSQFGSVQYDNVPLEKDIVRAWSYPSGIFIYKHEFPTKVITFFQVDAKLDVVPPAVMNAAMPSFVKGYFKALQGTEKIDWTPLHDIPGRRNC